LATLNYNPELPVYAAPDTQFSNVALPDGAIQSPESQVNPANTVEGRATGMLATGNQFLQAAQAASNRTMNSRGLLNSSMAASAGTKAAIETAIPIATADSAMFGDMEKQNNQARNDSALNNQVANLEYQKSLNNAAITGALTTQEAQKSFEMQKMQDNAQMQRIEIDNAFKAQANLDSLDSNERNALISTSAAMSSEMMGSIERIMRDTNIEGATAKQAAIDAVIKNYRANLTTAGAIVGLNLTWS
jgi:hypothetical protein